MITALKSKLRSLSFESTPRSREKAGKFLVIFVMASIVALLTFANRIGTFVGDEIVSGTPEHDSILRSLETICRVDEKLCTKVKPLSFRYYHVNVDYVGKREEVAYREGDEVEVTIDPSAFVNVALLNVQLYHRLLHLVSDIHEMDRAEINTNTACLEENRVKAQTYEFAQRLDSKLATGDTPMKNHVFYASGWNNTLESCGIDL